MHDVLAKGDLQAGGSATVGYSHYSEFNVGFSPALQYFIADKFSMGGDIQGIFDALTSQISIGSKAAYHFWSSDKWVANVALSSFFSRSNLNGRSSSGFTNFFDVVPSSSLLYFIMPSVAVGPTLRLDIPINWATYDGSTIATYALYAHLAVFF